MTYQKEITLATVLLSLGALVQSMFGIFANHGDGRFSHTTIRGETVEIYGKGAYRQMTWDVAVQGIAHDYVTLCLAIPLLYVTLYFARKGSVRAKVMLSGVLLYFVLTYLFYTAMAMYNEMFLVAAFSLSAALFAFITNLIGFDYATIKSHFTTEKYLIVSSYYLIVMVILMSLLWLSIIVPPLVSGTLYPETLAHYTTLIVQGFDFGIFLPFAVISAILALRKHAFGYVFVPTYLVFLSILMTALVAKIISMARQGVDVIPAVYIIPVMLLSALGFSYATLCAMHENNP